MSADDTNLAPPLAEANEAGLTDGNVWIAEHLSQAAALLAAQGANPLRILAYREAADAISALKDDIRHVAEGPGLAGLEAIPGIGPPIAGAVAELLATGRWGFLERLRGAAEPEALFCSIPGIGAALAHRIHEALHLDSLEQLAAAIHDGRLARLSGFGPRRSAAVRATIADLLGHVRPTMQRSDNEPDVALLLDVDREYREKAAQGTLHRIMPKRFAADHEVWLPVLHTVRNDWHFTALYSNTALAHRPGPTDDWVVVYFHCDGKPEGRRTMVSETHRAGHSIRVVRGREAESRSARAA